ncbi:MAG: molybdopterin converting factor subunit 1 [Neptuniibacter sp.]|jgi:molybdopterin synthase sulfur carrier subunit
MLKLVFFASLRERLGTEGENLELPDGVSTVAELISYLVKERGPIWQQVLQSAQVLVAVNQEMCDPGEQITSGDEIAFFPPVTGG